MIALPDIVHHAANAEVVFVGAVTTVVLAVTTLIHRNTMFVLAGETVVESATHIGCGEIKNRVITRHKKRITISGISGVR